MERPEVKAMLLEEKLEMITELEALAGAFNKKLENRDKDWTTHVQRLWETVSALMYQSAILTELLIEKNILTREDIDMKAAQLTKEAESNGANIKPANSEHNAQHLENGRE